MNKQAEDMPDLAALLNRHRDQIAAAWAQEIRRLPGSRYNELALEEIQSSTSRGVAAILDALTTGSQQAVHAHVADLAAARVEMGFDISEVIEALLLLKEAVLPAIRQTYPAGSRRADDALLLLDTSLRSMVGRFGHLYAEAMNRNLQAQQERTALESLQRMTTALLQKLTLEQVLQIVCREARKLTGATGCALYSLQDKAWLQLAHSGGTLKPPAHRMPLVGTLAGRAVQSGQPLLINDADDLMRTSHPISDIQSLLVIPLRLREAVVGALDVANKPDGFTQQDVQILSLFADGAAIAIESARLQQQAEQLAVMEERQRLARELHDSVTQALYSVTLYAEATRMAMSAGRQDVASQNLHELHRMAREAMIDMRMLIFELHPPTLEEEGLVAALQSRLAAVEARAGLQTVLRVEGERRLSLSTEEELFWIAVEAFNNVIKHAKAQQVEVQLRFDHSVLRLEIKDDGIGFNPATTNRSGGIGLRSMAERVERIGGELEITSAPGSGTTVHVKAEI